MMRSSPILWLAGAAPWAFASPAHPGAAMNPILPGMNPDPSCVTVPELSHTTFCTTSSFLLFPGAPVYASRDLQNWKHISNAFMDETQLPELARRGTEAEGIWASTLRWKDGTFYLITSYVSWIGGWGPELLLFTTDDVYDEGAWKGPLRVENPGNDIDPDLFWDDDGTVYMSVAAGMYVSEVNLETGAATEPFTVWNGTGARNPEGPHFYKRDDWYYLLIGEGGTEVNHTATMARSRNIRGPYEEHPDNPILSAIGTDELFQTVGHADFFQDVNGNWWGAALATRSGPEWEIYPMGRETCLFPVEWDDGSEWPVVEQIQGQIKGSLPRVNKGVPGDGRWAGDSVSLDFKPGSKLPRDIFSWRLPKQDLVSVSPKRHPWTLEIQPSRVNISGDAAYDPENEGLGLVLQKQTASLFSYSVDISFDPRVEDEEAGITVFLTQAQHIDLGIVNLPSKKGKSPKPHFRFRAETSGKEEVEDPEVVVEAIPKSWLWSKIRLTVEANKDLEYVFYAQPVWRPWERREVGRASALIVSGGSGPFTGKSLIVFQEPSLMSSFQVHSSARSTPRMGARERRRHILGDGGSTLLLRRLTMVFTCRLERLSSSHAPSNYEREQSKLCR